MSSSSLRRCRLPFHSPRTGSSTAQANLAKILSIIVTVPPSTSSADSAAGNGAFPDANDISTSAPEVAVNLDLRLGLGVEMPRGSEAFSTEVGEEEEEEEGIPTAHSGVVNCPNQTASYEASTVNKVSKKAPSAVDSISEADTSSEGECSPEAAAIKHGTKEISEITNTSCKVEDDIDKEAEGDGGYLDLLLEAARQVSSECGNDLDDETDKNPSPSPSPPPPPPPAAGTKKRSRTSPPPMRSKPRRKSSPAPPAAAATAAFNACDETEPIIRSRRGRTQALPSRYRDSILEPWRKPPTVFRR